MCRKPEILSDAAWLILTSPSSNSGNFFIDDALLAAHGITDLDKYAWSLERSTSFRIFS